MPFHHLPVMFSTRTKRGYTSAETGKAGAPSEDLGNPTTAEREVCGALAATET
jgi:hypothetical protein